MCKLHGHDNTYLFAVRCLMQSSPFQLLLVSLLISVFFFGYGLRIFERYVIKNTNKCRPLTDATGQNFNNLANALWTTIVTMTTVGYGDFYPKSHMGRFMVGAPLFLARIVNELRAL